VSTFFIIFQQRVALLSQEKPVQQPQYFLTENDELN
jgi:hypothetical protein